MKIEEFDFNLPEKLIAQHPNDKRDEARLMVLNRKDRTIEDKIFKDIIEYLNEGDCLVINNTKVIPARLYGKKVDSDINVEILLLKRVEEDIWEVIVKPGRRLKTGAKIIFGDGLLKGTIIDILENGNRKIK